MISWEVTSPWMTDNWEDWKHIEYISQSNAKNQILKIMDTCLSAFFLHVLEVSENSKENISSALYLFNFVLSEKGK